MVLTFYWVSLGAGKGKAFGSCFFFAVIIIIIIIIITIANLYDVVLLFPFLPCRITVLG